MSYIPTTEEVRDAFSDYKEDDAGGWFKAEAGFDRWLAEVKAQERKRIINVLNQHRLPNCNGDTDESGYCLTCTINLHDAICIINGEDDAVDSS